MEFFFFISTLYNIKKVKAEVGVKKRIMGLHLNLNLNLNLRI